MEYIARIARIGYIASIANFGSLKLGVSCKKDRPRQDI